MKTEIWFGLTKLCHYFTTNVPRVGDTIWLVNSGEKRKIVAVEWAVYVVDGTDKAQGEDVRVFVE